SGDGLGVDAQIVLIFEGLRPETSAHLDLRWQRVVGTREQHHLLAARELARGRVERLIEAGAQVDREIGDGRRLDRAREAQRLARGLPALVDANELTAARAGELSEELMAR